MNIHVIGYVSICSICLQLSMSPQLPSCRSIFSIYDSISYLFFFNSWWIVVEDVITTVSLLKKYLYIFWGVFLRGSETFTLEVWICWKTSRNMTNKIFEWRVYFLQLIVFCWVALTSSLQQPVQVIIIRKNYIYMRVCVCVFELWWEGLLSWIFSPFT